MKRPTGVTIIAIIAIIYGAFNLLLMLLGVFGVLLKRSGVAPIKYSVGTLAYATTSDAILGILLLVFGIGALRLVGWAWTVGVAALALEAVRSLVDMVMQGFAVGKIILPIITIVIALALLWYLFRPNVRAAFRQSA